MSRLFGESFHHSYFNSSVASHGRWCAGMVQDGAFSCVNHKHILITITNNKNFKNFLEPNCFAYMQTSCTCTLSRMIGMGSSYAFDMLLSCRRLLWPKSWLMAKHLSVGGRLYASRATKMPWLLAKGLLVFSSLYLASQCSREMVMQDIHDGLTSCMSTSTCLSLSQVWCTGWRLCASRDLIFPFQRLF